MVTRFRHAGSLALTLALMLAMPFDSVGLISRAEAYSAPTSFADLAEQVKHSVANISTTRW